MQSRECPASDSVQCIESCYGGGNCIQEGGKALQSTTSVLAASVSEQGNVVSEYLHNVYDAAEEDGDA